MKIREAAVAAVQLAGLVSVAVGAFMLAAWFGFVVAGAALVAVGVAAERR